MLYVCIPVHNEAATVGVLLWRLRTVLQDAAGGAGREYEVVVYDDASTDATADVLAPYADVLPLTVLGGAAAPRLGPSGATAALLRHVAGATRYPRRDACLVVQGDFTEAPEDVPAFLAAFDGGADLVVGRRAPSEALPPAERRLRRLAPWVLRPLVRVEGVDDLLAGPRLLRGTVVRDLVRGHGDGPLLRWAGWAGRAELVVAAAPLARRVAVVDAPARPGVRTRDSRLDWAHELRALARFAWQARGTRARPTAGGAPTTAAAADPASGAVTPQGARAEVPRRRPPSPEAAPRAARTERAGRARPAGGAGVATPAAAEPDGTDAPPAERPRALGRGRRGRPAGATEVAGSAPRDAAHEGGAVGSEAATHAPAPPEHPAPPVIQVPAAGPNPDVVPADDTPAGETAAVRKKRKRRPKRRSGGAGGAAPDGPGDTGREPSGADAGRVAGAGALGDAPDHAPDDDERANARTDAAPEADGPSGAASESEAGAPDAARARKRRRRRTRARSGEGGSGVPTEDHGAAPSADAPPAPPPARLPDRPTPVE